MIDGRDPQNGSSNNPAIKKRNPAKKRGSAYFNPLLTPAKAVAHSKQAKTANTGEGIFLTKLNSFPFEPA